MQNLRLKSLFLILPFIGACGPSAPAGKSEVERSFEEQIKAWIAKDENVNQVSVSPGDSDSPLMWASMYAYADSVDMLLSHGADPKIMSNDYTPLYKVGILAAGQEERALRIAESLVQHGADVNASNSAQQTPLQWAAMDNFKGVVEFLLNHGADINAADKLGQTALHQAASGGYPAVIQVLLDHGANINAQDINGKTPLFWCDAQSKETSVNKSPGRDYAGALLMLRQHGAQ